LAKENATDIKPGGPTSEHQVNYSRSSRHAAPWLSAEGLSPSQGSRQRGPSLPVIVFRALTAKAIDNIHGFPPTFSQPGKLEHWSPQVHPRIWYLSN